MSQKGGCLVALHPQKNISLSIIEKLDNKFNSKITTKVSKIKNYTKAEDYHQKYLEKNRF